MSTQQIPGGIQPWSKGVIFPAVIARVERYMTEVEYDRAFSRASAPPFRFAPIEARYIDTFYELTLGEFCEKYATREDAEMVARGLLEGVRVKNRAAMLAVTGELPPDAPYVRQQVALLAADGSEC